MERIFLIGLGFLAYVVFVTVAEGAEVSLGLAPSNVAVVKHVPTHIATPLSGEPGGDRRREKQDKIAYPKQYLLAGVLGCPLGRFRHTDLLTKILVVGGAFSVVFGLGFFGGFAVPERPKLGYALITAGGVGLLLVLIEIATPCSVQIDSGSGKADRQRYSSDNRKV